jgi:hypothetical protein
MPMWKRRIAFDTGPVQCLCISLVCALGLVFSMAARAADDGSYLELLNKEAMKQGVVARPETAGGAEQVDAFEALLQKDYRGSYLFFKKLPPRSQEEILLDYQNGASINDVRKKIMDKFLHKE